MISFLKFIQGFLYISLNGKNIERFLNYCAKHHILIWNIKRTQEECYCCISKKSLPVVKELLGKTGLKMIICKKCGLPFFLYYHRKRRIFALCSILAAIVLYGMSFFLWDISIKGNETLKTSEILNYVTQHYVHGGQLLSTIDTVELEEKLRTHYDNFAWVSCEIKGTRLTIHIKETINLNLPHTSKKPCNLQANKSGKIVSIITRSGTPKVKPGQKVKSGEVLISGEIYYKNDAGEEYEKDYVAADGDIVIETYYNYDDRVSLRYYKKKYTGEEKNGYKLSVFGNDYNIFQPDITDKKVDMQQNIYHFKLGETFYFPISLTKYSYRSFSLQQVVLSKTQAKNELQKRFQKYCRKMQKKGVEIVGNNVKINMFSDKLTATGKLKVLEAVGKVSLIDTTKKENVNEHSGETD